MPPNQDASSMSVTKMLKRHVGEPVKVRDRILTLKSGSDAHSKCATFYVVTS
jgi:hypothetical protein